MHRLRGLVPKSDEKQKREKNTGANAIVVGDTLLMSRVI